MLMRGKSNRYIILFLCVPCPFLLNLLISINHQANFFLQDDGRESSFLLSYSPIEKYQRHCLGLSDYFEEASFAEAIDGLANFHQRGGNLKSVQKFMDGSIDYTLEKLDLKFIPNKQSDENVEKATEYLKTFYEQNPSLRQGYGEPLPGKWSNQKSKALFGERFLDTMEKREGRAKWDASLGPMGPKCKEVKQLGDRRGDGYKFICVVPQNTTQRTDTHERHTDCHVISVGGNDNWKFEQSVVETLGCETYTFDCTLPGGTPKRKPQDDRIHFFNYCIDGHNHEDVHGRKFVTYDEMLNIANIQQAPEYFKMDVEGYEYDIFTQMVNNDHALLPQQIQVELHWATRMTGLPWMPRMRSAGEIALLMGMLYNVAHYMPVKLDFNPYCTSCMEVLLFRGAPCNNVTRPLS